MPPAQTTCGGPTSTTRPPRQRRHPRREECRWRCSPASASLDHGKAERELGWKLSPVNESIRAAVDFYTAQGMVPQRSVAALDA